MDLVILEGYGQWTELGNIELCTKVTGNDIIFNPFMVGDVEVDARIHQSMLQKGMVLADKKTIGWRSVSTRNIIYFNHQRISSNSVSAIENFVWMLVRELLMKQLPTTPISQIGR
jgi:hypothetical protein